MLGYIKVTIRPGSIRPNDHTEIKIEVETEHGVMCKVQALPDNMFQSYFDLVMLQSIEEIKRMVKSTEATLEPK